MKEFVRCLLLSLCLACGLAVAADEGEPIYGGCVDAAGAGVPALADPGLPAVVATSVEAGRAVIRYNPEVLPRLRAETRLFLFAQACARLNLGHPAQGELDAAAARRADCAAVATLRRSGFAEPGTIAAIEADLQLTDEEWTRVPGPRRAVELAGCQGRGNLLLPDAGAAGRPAWNACVRACAAPLYQCQARCAAAGCPDCEAAYERCQRACGSR